VGQVISTLNGGPVNGGTGVAPIIRVGRDGRPTMEAMGDPPNQAMRAVSRSIIPPMPDRPPDRRSKLDVLLAKARSLPKTPGVYLMKDDRGRVIYVGKAARLPDRVSSYFVPSATRSSGMGPQKLPMRDLRCWHVLITRLLRYSDACGRGRCHLEPGTVLVNAFHGGGGNRFLAVGGFAGWRLFRGQGMTR
jgi:hypothetical protein